MATEFAQNNLLHDFCDKDLPPHIPRVRPADRERVLTFIEQTRAELEEFEAAEMSTTTDDTLRTAKQAEAIAANTPAWYTALTTAKLAAQIYDTANDDCEEDLASERAEHTR